MCIRDSPGTVLDHTVLDESKNNYIMSIFGGKNGYGLSVCDVSTGEFQTTEFPTILAASRILDEVARFSPAEVVCNEAFLEHPVAKDLKERFRIAFSDVDNRMFAYATAKDTLAVSYTHLDVYKRQEQCCP